MMDELIVDIVSIFKQLLMLFAPEYVNDYAFLLSGYIACCGLMVLLCLAFFALCGYVVKFCVRRFGGI